MRKMFNGRPFLQALKTCKHAISIIITLFGVKYRFDDLMTRYERAKWVRCVNHSTTLSGQILLEFIRGAVQKILFHFQD